ncbi:MAG: hypothetical protein ACSLFK_08810 [Gemmatimonadaceae bacterium]
MPFAEPRPHRRPFFAHGDRYLTVVPASQKMNLAVTSFTVANQDTRSHFVLLISTDGSSKVRLLEVLVPAESTMHIPFPHPLMVGAGRSLIAEDEASSPALAPMTVVGYQWLADDERHRGFSLREIIGKYDPVR